MQPLGHTVESIVERLVTESVNRRDVPLEVARAAGRATLSAMGHERPGNRLTRRAHAYYWTVVRRKLTRSNSAPDVSARYVLSTVARDLESAGRDADAIWEELVRGWSGRVPEHILEEYRPLACA